MHLRCTVSGLRPETAGGFATCLRQALSPASRSYAALRAFWPFGPKDVRRLASFRTFGAKLRCFAAKRLVLRTRLRQAFSRSFAQLRAASRRYAHFWPYGPKGPLHRSSFGPFGAKILWPSARGRGQSGRDFSRLRRENFAWCFAPGYGGPFLDYVQKGTPVAWFYQATGVPFWPLFGLRPKVDFMVDFRRLATAYALRASAGLFASQKRE